MTNYYGEEKLYLVQLFDDYSQYSNQFGTTKQRDTTYKKDRNNYEKQFCNGHYEVNSMQDSPSPYHNTEVSNENYRSLEPGEEKKMITLKYPHIEIKYPGETKNMPKCFARQLQNIMKNIKDHTNDSQIKEMFSKPDVKKFLRSKSDDIGKKKLDDFIQSEIGQIIAQDFFGNCRWIYGLVKENKTNVESYFRHNKIYFYETQKAKKTRLN